MKCFFHEDAETEFFNAISYYENCDVGLGLKFSKEIFITIQRICNFPYAWEKMDSKTYRCLTEKFPYAVLYRISNDKIVIMAVMHLHRKPDYWSVRKNN